MSVAAVVGSPVLPGEEVSSPVVSKQPASPKLRLRFSPGSWPGFRLPFSRPTLTMAKRLIPAQFPELGKLASQGLVKTISPGQMVYITDQLSHRQFPVDTGAAFSVFPNTLTRSPVGRP
jgi:hypothetical protein